MTRRGMVAKVCTNMFQSSVTTLVGLPIDRQIYTPTEKFAWMPLMSWRLLGGSSAPACEAFDCCCCTASFGAPPPLLRMHGSMGSFLSEALLLTGRPSRPIWSFCMRVSLLVTGKPYDGSEGASVELWGNFVVAPP
jgi:hypothetical protein